MAYADLQMPGYITSGQNAEAPTLKLVVLSYGEPLNLIVHCMGLKVSRDGEWKMRKHS
jgi:hypothetical protein